MEINFNVVLNDIRGKALKEASSSGQGEDDLTLGAVAIGGMLTQEQGCEGKEKFKRWELASKIQSGLDEGALVDLNAAEVAKIRKQIGKLYNPVVVGGAWTLLDKMK
jgi:hypothetical protein